MTTLVDLVDEALGASERAYAPNAVIAPIAVLWPDEQRQWGHVVESLRNRRTVLTYGEYDADTKSGPAYWIRCALAGTVEIERVSDAVPIVYMPGVGRSVLRDLAELPPELESLAALQFRSQWFNHPNGKDWTVRALLAGEDPGAGLDVASDAATAKALVDGLPLVAELDLESLQGRSIDAAFVQAKLMPDLPRRVLQWIDDPEATQEAMSVNEWNAFVNQLRSDYSFDVAAGPISAAERLGKRAGPWGALWERFREAPADYERIPERLQQAQPTELFAEHEGSWPGVAEAAEDRLRNALHGLAGSTAEAARATIGTLEREHGGRRDDVWADLGRTPLAVALEHLARVAELTVSGAPGATTDEIQSWYSEQGWLVDRAVLGALAPVERSADVDAISAALDVVYRPWLDRHAEALQAAVGPAVNAGTYVATPGPDAAAGEVVMFVDGLRLDVAHMLGEWFANHGVGATITTGLAALPTVTESSKPALAPVRTGAFGGGPDLRAGRAADGQAVDIAVLRKHIADAGVQVLGADEVGDPAGSAWVEAGEVDHLGHDRGVGIAHELDHQIRRIGGRVRLLLDSGWSTVRIVTDHGWLLLPGGLPKNGNLPAVATETKKGRCARIKSGAEVSVPTVPWHWDPSVRIALAPGISCFEANKVYEHGGVSPQECIVPRMVVSAGTNREPDLALASMKWVRLTLKADFVGLPAGSKVQLRTVPADGSTVVAEPAKMTGEPGRVLLMIMNEDLEGSIAYLTVSGADGALLWQREVTIGRNR